MTYADVPITYESLSIFIILTILAVSLIVSAVFERQEDKHRQEMYEEEWRRARDKKEEENERREEQSN